MSKIVPFLWFPKGKMSEAIAFYRSIFPEARVVFESPMTAEFELAGQSFMALDAEPHSSFNDSVSFFVRCKDQAEVDHYWNALLKNGGEESMCGWLHDQFGVRWQIIPEALGRCLGHPDRERAGRAMQAMLKMRKIIVAELEAAVAD